MTQNGIAWSYTYDANGMRTQRASNYATYRYFYNGGLLVRMTKGSAILRFTYDASGMPMSVIYGGEQYFYATNLQGDVVALLDGSGDVVVRYTYDAWGNVLSIGGDLADTLGEDNPLRYRGYVYDTETGLYYLQSRYYNPQWGRFINADAYISTGQGLLGYNMLAYCGNNPVCYVDYTGYIPSDLTSCFVEVYYGQGQYSTISSRLCIPNAKKTETVGEMFRVLSEFVVETLDEDPVEDMIGIYKVVAGGKKIGRGLATIVTIPDPTFLDEIAGSVQIAYGFGQIVTGIGELLGWIEEDD